MEISSNIIIGLVNFVFMLSLGFYLMQNLQWYNYSFFRIICKHSKPYWHFLYIILPIVVFVFVGKYFYIYLICHIILLGYWYKRLDKKLVWTSRVKRFFITYAVFLVISFVVLLYVDISRYIWFLALFASLVISYISEVVIISQYKKLAIEKINAMPHLTIIAITASYGKTSIKNFIYALLSKKFKTYATPRSVNTINGIVSDINNNLANDCEIYIIEAGARKSGDIEEIANFINPQYIVIGEIGEAHLQYFRTIENIQKTKYELFESNRLQEVFLYKSNPIPKDIKSHITLFPPEISDIDCNLSGTSFRLAIEGERYLFHTQILGRFNITNLSVAIMVALKFGFSPQELQDLVSHIKPIEHRLEKIEINGKIILDDSFNGNLSGMSEAINLASLHKNGKKIIVTPGLVESSVENNIKLATLIDNVFDIAIITGDLNSKVLSSHISKAQKIIIKDKVNLNNILSQFCASGDLILFANDAPNYI